jgi:amidohydrolase
MSDGLQDWIARHRADFVSIRRDIHAHPELGFEENRTAALVAEQLRTWGIETHEGVGRTGVVGVIKGRHGGDRAIGLRADLDALAMTETTGVDYASRTRGKMHACGHDGHATMLLGAARYLAENPDFSGRVHLIFQPSEENVQGALAMIDDGLFDRFPCASIYGMHNTAGMAQGHFATGLGAMQAAGDFWWVTFRGVGGHGGLAPHRTTDITYAQAHFVLGLQGIVGRNIAPLDTAVISIGYIAAGRPESPNVVPSELTLAGTARSYTDEVRDTIERRISELAQATAQAWGCRAEAEYTRGCCALINRPAQVEIAIAAATAVVGAANVDGKLRPTTGSEDFAELSRIVPGAFMRIGNGASADGSFHAPHTTGYDFNDEVIPDGIAYWVNVVRQELGMPAP